MFSGVGIRDFRLVGQMPVGAMASIVQAMGSWRLARYVRPNLSVTSTVISASGLLVTAIKVWVLYLVPFPSPTAFLCLYILMS